MKQWSKSVALMLVAVVAMGVQECGSGDADGDGVPASVDCDDDNPKTFPGAQELCDAEDNDCDGVLDNGLELHSYPDEDKDTFGDTSRGVCLEEMSGYINTRGDCDDTNSDVHPGADDPDGDRMDSDCGGTDRQQPFVGLNPHGLLEIQEAIRQAESGETIWVGPGFYFELLDFDSMELVVISTHGAEQTVIDAEEHGTTVQFSHNTDQAANPVLDGFTITGGSAYYGGGIYVYGSSGKIQNCDIIGNSAEYSGGGIYILQGVDVLVENSEITSNYTTSSQDIPYIGGAGMTVNEYSTVVMERVLLLANNTSGWGGGLYVSSRASVIADNLTLHGNVANRLGAGVYVQDDTTLLDCANCAFIANQTTGSGGGLYANSGEVHLTNALLLGNNAHNGGAIATAGDAFLWVDFAAIVGNFAYSGAAIEMNERSWAYFDSTIVAFQDGAEDISVVGYDTLLQVWNSDFWTEEWNQIQGNIWVDPAFVSYDPADWDPMNDDFHLQGGSQCVDAGEPSYTDPDGSQSDMGAFGGDRARWWDIDLDGYYAWSGVGLPPPGILSDCNDFDSAVGPCF